MLFPRIDLIGAQTGAGMALPCSTPHTERRMKGILRLHTDGNMTKASNRHAQRQHAEEMYRE